MLVLMAILGGVSTYYLCAFTRMGSIRSSSVCTLFFFTLCYAFVGSDVANTWSTVFFGGSFVGMSSPSRLSTKGVVFAAAMFGVISASLLPYLKGVGGAVGVCAFVSVIIINMATLCFRRIKKHNTNG